MERGTTSRSTSIRWSALTVVLMMAVTACAILQQPPTTATPLTSPTTSLVTPNGRTVQMVDCAEADSSVVFVCEAYELIADRFVDDVDSAAMAAATTELLVALEEVDSDDPLLCPLPSQDWVATCKAAAAIGLDSEDTAELLLDAMVQANLDVNSAYLDPQALDRALDAESPNFAGIGAHVRAEDETIEGDDKQCNVISETCRIYIVATLENHPARAAGVLPNDVAVEVDGQPIIGWTVDDVVAAVRGPVGDPVTILFDRDGTPVEITIIRDLILVPVIESERIGDTGYIRLYDFSSAAPGQFEQAIVDLLADGVERIVFDLRYNPGGLLDVAIAITSVFLEDGDVVVTQSPERTTPYPVNGRSIVPEDMEVHVVVNRASASASEVVSAVLQERGRAVIYGENSFGKNTVQQRWNLSNGGALKLTTARWLTPGGGDFGAVGVTPDVPLELGQDITPEEVVAAVLNGSAG